MKKHWVLMISFALFFLLFIQAITVFIESIYILELLSTSLDEKVLGVLFLFSPVFLFLFGKEFHAGCCGLHLCFSWSGGG